MYSINGRLKKDKEQANKQEQRQVLCCNNCGFVLKNTSKEFGETIICPKCGSSSLDYKLK